MHALRHSKRDCVSLHINIRPAWLQLALHAYSPRIHRSTALAIFTHFVMPKLCLQAGVREFDGLRSCLECGETSFCEATAQAITADRTSEYMYTDQDVWKEDER
jgi:hypothetical protein